MSKNNNYQNYYKKPKAKETSNELKESIEDVRTAEATEEAPKEKVLEEPKEAITKTAIVKGASKVNLRKAPSKTAPVEKVLSEGTVVTILDEFGEWTKVSIPGNFGYIMSKFLVPAN